ncbi:hypothetical protein RE6C_02404 [Rhodopirellula europaea 6C]|uniref:Uncharacterized protein n=1 Tax=Rhodopirellula europaea 6C TaxID=1263867 RepID=M2A6X1_9BACT|nr:hypothetical protein RE6C_02404 [Rhodopirellula europaea 6C]
MVRAALDASDPMPPGTAACTIRFRGIPIVCLPVSSNVELIASWQ